MCHKLEENEYGYIPLNYIFSSHRNKKTENKFKLCNSKACIKLKKDEDDDDSGLFQRRHVVQRNMTIFGDAGDESFFPIKGKRKGFVKLNAFNKKKSITKNHKKPEKQETFHKKKNKIAHGSKHHVINRKKKIKKTIEFNEEGDNPREKLRKKRLHRRHKKKIVKLKSKMYKRTKLTRPEIGK